MYDPHSTYEDVKANLTDVVSVVASGAGSAAVREDGSVIRWYESKTGGGESDDAYRASLNEKLASGVVQVYGRGNYLLALKENADPVVWGDP